MIDLNRLQSQLLISGIQTTNQPLYQVINQLIKYLRDSQISINGRLDPLGVGSGGTGTSIIFTEGSVIFAGPGGVYSQDNANFFWNDATNNLVLTGLVSGFPLEIHSTFAAGPGVYTHSDSGFRAPSLDFFRSKNTQASPNPVTITNDLSFINFSGYDGAAYTLTAQINVKAVDNYSGATALGSEFLFKTIGTGVTTLRERLRIGGGTDVETSIAVDNGSVYFLTDNTYDFGLTGSNRPRTGYFGTSIFAPIILGGLGVTSTLTLRPTSGIGAAGADIIFGVGTNGATEVARMLNAGYILVPAGTQSQPSINFRTVTNGVYSPGVNQLGLSTNGTQALNLASNQNATFTNSMYVGASAYFGNNGRSLISSPADGRFIFSNNSGAGGAVTLAIGTSAFPSTGTDGLAFGDGTALATMGSNTAGLYADDVAGTVRMFGIDEAGVTGALVMASANLTSGKIPVAGTNGLLKDSTTTLLLAGTIPSIVASTFEKAETGTDANILTYTAGAADEFLVVQVATDVSAITGTSIVVTITWKDSNNSTATSTLTLTAVGDGTLNVPLNSFTATNVVVSSVFVGVSTAYKVSAFITRLK